MSKPWDDNADLKVQNYGPDQSQGKFWVAVCDVIIPDVYKFDLMTGEKWLAYLQYHQMLNKSCSWVTWMNCSETVFCLFVLVPVI